MAEIRHDGDTNEGRLGDLLAASRDTLRRRWLTLAAISLVIFGLGAAYVLRMTPQYDATARVRIDPSRNPLQQQQATANGELSSESIETEVTAMYSLDLARSVVRRLNLVSNPVMLSQINPEKVATPADRETAVASLLLAKLAVYREKLTYILGVQYQSPDPALAAQIANAFAENYIDARVGDRVGTAERQSEWFTRRLAELASEVRAADEKVAQFRAAAGIVADTSTGESGQTIADQQVAPLAGTLAAIESEAAGARANLAAAQGAGRRGNENVAEVLNSSVIGDLRRQRAEVLRQQADVQARYGPLHPDSVRVGEQLATLDTQIAQETRRIVGSLRSTASAADARVQSLRGSLAGLEQQRSQNTRNSVLADSLAREAAAKRAQYDKMSQMSLESTQAARNSISQAAIIDKAEAPTAPTSPNKPLLLALALILGVGVGAAVITVQELMGGGLRTTEEVEDRIGLPVLAAVPKAAKGVAKPADQLIERPTSFFAEALRIARAAILGVRGTESPRVIAITSALPSEGKTTTALAFARTLAIANARTLLIECDVRRAALRAIVNAPVASVGLVEVLRGEAPVEAAISSGDVANLDQLLVTQPFYSSENLFGEGAMERLLGELRGRYDQIVLDLPPLVGLADGRFVAVLADATAVVVRWEETPQTAVASAVKMLRSDGANPVGVIFTLVDSSAEVMGGLYYSKKYSDYYKAA